MSNLSHHRILILGSGRSALEHAKVDLDDFQIVCINHAWQLLPDRFDFWFHAGDFPLKKYPRKDHGTWVTSGEASEAVEWCKGVDPELRIGDLTFPKCVCWVIANLKPKYIAFLGCDHDYDAQAVSRWMEAKQPGPQNNFIGNGDPQVPIEVHREQRAQSPLTYGQATPECLDDWSQRFFHGLQSTHFYGHGTPDPMRVGVETLISNFASLARLGLKLGIEMVNYSSCEQTLLPFPRNHYTERRP